MMAERGGIVVVGSFAIVYFRARRLYEIFSIIQVSSSVAAKFNSHCAQATMKMLAKQSPWRDWCRRLQTSTGGPLVSRGTCPKAASCILKSLASQRYARGVFKYAMSKSP